jgi:hypothetical protein
MTNKPRVASAEVRFGRAARLTPQPVYVLYVDESGSHGLFQNNQAYVLAGVAIHEADIRRLGDQLRDVVLEVTPGEVAPASYEIHAAELRHPPAGSPWKAIDGQVRRATLERALRTIASFEELDPRRPLRLFVDVLPPGGEHEREAYGNLLNRFDDWLAEIDEHGIVISDVSYRERDIQAWAKRWRRTASRWGTLDQLVEVPLFADSTASRLLQAADLIAWSAWRHFGVVPHDDHWWQIIEPRVDLERVRNEAEGS